MTGLSAPTHLQSAGRLGGEYPLRLSFSKMFDEFSVAEPLPAFFEFVLSGLQVATIVAIDHLQIASIADKSSKCQQKGIRIHVVSHLQVNGSCGKTGEDAAISFLPSSSDGYPEGTKEINTGVGKREYSIGNSMLW